MPIMNPHPCESMRLCASLPESLVGTIGPLSGRLPCRAPSTDRRKAAG